MKIIIKGKGGHGVKMGAQVLGNILADRGKQVSVSYEYSAAIRGQDITASIVVSDRKIKNPVVEKADETYKTEDFEQQSAEKFGSQMYVTMMILGKILKKMGITVEKEEFNRYVKKEKELNWKALYYFSHCK